MVVVTDVLMLHIKYVSNIPQTMENVQHSVPGVKMEQCKKTMSMWNKQ
jgi:hypothetical protein